MHHPVFFFVIRITLSQCLLWARHSAELFTYIHSLHPHSHPMRQRLLISSFCRWGNGGIEKLSALPQRIHLCHVYSCLLFYLIFMLSPRHDMHFTGGRHWLSCSVLHSQCLEQCPLHSTFHKYLLNTLIILPVQLVARSGDQDNVYFLNMS